MASLERYSRHPLAAAILSAASRAGLTLQEADEVSERPGEGLRGKVKGRLVQITSRNKLAKQQPGLLATIPSISGGMECVVLIDGRYAGVSRFRDEPRAEGRPFIRHLGANEGTSLGSGFIPRKRLAPA